MAFCNDSGFTEGVRYYSFHSLPLKVEVKRSVSYVLSFHNQREYRLKGYPCQPPKKIILSLDTCERCDIINAVVNVTTIAGWSNGKTVLCKRTIEGSIPSPASILKKLYLRVDLRNE